jgi:hypothetical protein
MKTEIKLKIAAIAEHVSVSNNSQLLPGYVKTGNVFYLLNISKHCFTLKNPNLT